MFILLFFLSLIQTQKTYAGTPHQSVQIQAVEIDRVEVSGVDHFSNTVIEPLVEIGPGEKLDRSKVLKTEENLQQFYVRHGYEEISIQSRLIRRKNDKGRIEIVLEFVVNEGRLNRIIDHVRFGFRGNTVFTKAYLDGLVADQKELGFGKDYVNLIRSKIIDEYRAAGYAKAEVIPYTFDTDGSKNRRVTYQIVEGQKIHIDTIRFDGNFIFTDEALLKQFYLKAGVSLRNGIFVEKEVLQAAELLTEWLKERGYLTARVITVNAVYLTKPRTQLQNSTVKVTIYLYEGDQTLVDSINVRDAHVFPVVEIADILKLQRGMPFNPFALAEGIETLRHYYFEKGYLDFKILNADSDELVKYSDENRSVSIALDLDEGVQFFLSRIEVDGLTVTEEEVVRRECQVLVGDVLRESQLAATERELRKLGIFSTVHLQVLSDPDKKNGKIIRISLVEADRGTLILGPGIRNDLGIRIFEQFSYSNLWGKNHTVSVNFSGNRRFENYHFTEGQVQVAYLWPWFANKAELNFRPMITAGRTQYINFYADNLTAAANWDKRLWKDPLVIAYAGYSFERIIQQGAGDSIDNGSFQIATLTPKLSIDLRDSPLSPTSGYYGVAWLDLAYPMFGTRGEPPIAYYRVQTRNDYYVSLFSGIVWSFSFRAGIEETQRSDDSIPLIKQFAIGGIGSLRGYQEQEIHNSAALVGGSLSYVNYRTQIDFPFAGALKLGGFLDAGNLTVNRFMLGSLLYGTGIGLHYQTPVGPVSLDWGFKIAPPPGADPYVIHFSVGLI